MLKKLRFIVPLLALAALVVWWFTPRYSEEDEAYYRSVFCLIDHHDSRAFLHDMESVVEGGNSDYALHKIRYIPALGEKMRQTWQQLSPDEQRASREDRQHCYQLMGEKKQD
ncbi:MAG TPA: hypothetical protein DIW62_16780 [Raoultella sp.]|nr:hypothetical protein [Raoultella terrigena]HCR59283.1 hypothetical protein [Raoultella sp.]